MKKSVPYFLFIFFSMLILFNTIPMQAASHRNIEKIAVLPFETNSLEDISYIRQGIIHMLHSRLSWKDRVAVEAVDVEQEFIDGPSGRPDPDRMNEIARQSNARYVLSGSITHFSGAFSIDIRIFDATEEKATYFYEQAGTVDNVIPELNKLAARINKDIFNRTTLAYREIERERTRHEQQLQRMNPESMMPYFEPREKEKAPFWKFWKHF